MQTVPKGTSLEEAREHVPPACPRLPHFPDLGGGPWARRQRRLDDRRPARDLGTEPRE